MPKKKKTILEYPRTKIKEIRRKMHEAEKAGMDTRRMFTNKTDIPGLETKLNDHIRSRKKKF